MLFSALLIGAISVSSPAGEFNVSSAAGDFSLAGVSRSAGNFYVAGHFAMG